MIAAALDECRRHLRYLRDAAGRISWPLTSEQMAAPDDRLVASLDQFAFRFARLQDTLGQKAFRAVLVGKLREPFEDSPMRDIGPACLTPPTGPSQRGRSARWAGWSAAQSWARGRE